jgi:hypothetical protein
MSPAEQIELAERARAGDEAAYRELIDQCRDAAKSSSEVGSTLHSSLPRAVRTWDANRGRSLVSWCLLLARQDLSREAFLVSVVAGGGQKHLRRCRRAWTARRRGQELSPDESAALAATLPGEPLENHAGVTESDEGRILARLSVAKLLEGLNERDRIAVQLRFGIGSRPHSITEIGHQLGISNTGAAMLITRAIVRLRSGRVTNGAAERHSACSPSK